jgi:hypothetical protein
MSYQDYSASYVPKVSSSVPASLLAPRASDFSEKMTDNFNIQRFFDKASANKFRAYVFYFFMPAFLFLLLSPGLLLSIPPTEDCDTGVKKPIAPKRVTFYNALVHSIVFGIVIFLLFWYGSHHKIVFPFSALALKT